MPPIPTPTDSAGPSPRSSLRQTRGYIQSYGEGRICLHVSCQTILSQYNRGMLCWKHSQPVESLAPRPGHLRPPG